MADRLGLNAVDQLFDNFEVDVGLKQRQTNLFHRLGDVLFREDSLSAKRLKGALEFFLEILEHSVSSYFSSRGEASVVGRLSAVIRWSSLPKLAVSS